MTGKKTEWVSASDVKSAEFCPKSLEMSVRGKKHSFEAKQRMSAGNDFHNIETQKAFQQELYAQPNRQDQRCYVATYAFGQSHPVTQTLRDWRDEKLLKHKHGRFLVDFYYKMSPKIIKIAGKNPVFHGLTKWVVARVAKTIARERKNNV